MAFFSPQAQLNSRRSCIDTLTGYCQTWVSRLHVLRRILTQKTSIVRMEDTAFVYDAGGSPDRGAPGQPAAAGSTVDDAMTSAGVGGSSDRGAPGQPPAAGSTANDARTSAGVGGSSDRGAPGQPPAAGSTADDAMTSAGVGGSSDCGAPGQPVGAGSADDAMTTDGSAPGQLDTTTSDSATTPDSSAATPLERDRHLAIKVRVCLLESSFFQRLGVTCLLPICSSGTLRWTVASLPFRCLCVVASLE